MRPKTTVVLLFVLLGLNCFNSISFDEVCKAADPPTFYVDDDNTAGPWDGSSAHPFRYIQDAIDAASSGDRIQVLAGTYTENLVIISDKTNLDLFGEDKATTIITGGGSGDVITISATGVDISDLTIKSSGTGSTNASIRINASNSVIVNNIISNSRYGFYIYNCSNTKIYYNTITTNSRDGIYIKNSDCNTITYSTITSSTYNGIFLYNCSNSSIENNTITSNSKNGIYLNSTCNDNTISKNYIASNTMNGIYLNDHCSNNLIRRHNGNNKIYSNSDSGIRLENSSSNNLGYNVIDSNSEYGIMVLGSNNIIHNSTISSNAKHGLFLFGDNDNKVMHNHIQGNTKDGIRIQNSTSDTIHTNNITQNSQYGIYLNYYSISTLIYNNYFYNNSDHALDMSENNNIWSISRTTGYSVINGAGDIIAGNYWDDYDNETEGAYDANNDGVADSGHSINISSTDSRPILDTNAPLIGTPSASPFTQTVGSYTYISATITDNTELEEVRLIITDPNGVNSNLSIIAYKTGNIYYYNHQFSVVGNYSYRIQARDPRNWAISGTYTFEIDEGTAPTITDNTALTGSPGTYFLFNATVTDDSDEPLDLTVKFDWSHGSKGGNYTLYHIGNNIFNAFGTLDITTADLTYTIYVCDQWGNSLTTSQTTVSIIDGEAPSIIINEDKHGSTHNDLPNSFTFGATITDDVSIETAYIEYWYGSSDVIAADMDYKGSNYYEKVLVIDSNPDRVYCVIYATDPTGNQNDTKKPFINFNGPYHGVAGNAVFFDATESYDLDGNVSAYAWTFGDGTEGTGGTTTHTYSSNDNYTITITITDNDGNTKTNTSYALINSTTLQKTTQATMSELEDDYDITLTELFYSYDTDGDAIADTFVDPNGVLTTVHSGQVNIDGNAVFLISIDDNEVPEFIWNAATDKIISITHTVGTIEEASISIDEPTDGQVTADAVVNKTSGWIYLEVADPDLGDTGEISNIINVTRGNIEIDDDKIIRKDGKIYILDDPDTEYQIIYNYIPPTLGHATFSPAQGEIINEESSTITISYNMAVDEIYAVFYILDNEGVSTLWEADISNQLSTSNWKIFAYTPPNNLIDGTYYLEVDAQDENGNIVYDSISYEFESYEPIAEEISLIPIFVIIGGIFGAVFAIHYIMKRKNITFESFIYFKNRKIIPFFKPIVFGPLRIDVDDEKVKKAEFFVNGQLKETITEAPYTWMMNGKAFMKHNIETKVYDEEGNMSTSGEMTFYLFNPPKLFK